MKPRQLLPIALLCPLLAQASLRCGQSLVEEGDSVDQVLAACGAPVERKVNPPALRNNGVPKFNAAETQFWTYARRTAPRVTSSSSTVSWWKSGSSVSGREFPSPRGRGGKAAAQA